MLIVCPSCATSYKIDPASVGAQGRNVRCARCKTLWFVDQPRPTEAAGVSAFVNDVIAEAQAPSPPPPSSPLPPVAEEVVTGPSSVDFPPEPPPPEPVSDETAAFRDALNEAPEPPASDQHIEEAPSLVPPAEPDTAEPGPAVDPPPVEDVEDFAARRARRQAKRKAKPKSKLPYIILTLVGINAALIAWRADVVRIVPQTASLYAALGLPVNLRGLEFQDVKISTEDEGMNVLVVEGNIVSTSRRTVEVPKLRFSVRNAAGNEIYAWTAQPGRGVLGPGENLPFRSRLSSPPAEAHDVLVRFFNAHDVSGGK